MIARIKAALDALPRLTALLEALVGVLSEAAQRVQGADQLEGRVDDLERGLSQVYAEAEALVTRAESRFGAARAAEERARGMERRAQALSGGDEGDEEGAAPLDAYLRALQDGHAPGGQEEGVQPVHQAVEPPLDGKELARRRKYGMM